MNSPRLLPILVLAFLLAGPVVSPAEEFEAPVPVRMVAPKYPAELRRDGTGGLVTISCVVDEKGNVTQAEVIRTTHSAFVQPALEALGKWRFKPAKRGGTPVALKVQIPIQFSIKDDQ